MAQKRARPAPGRRVRTHAQIAPEAPELAVAGDEWKQEHRRGQRGCSPPPAADADVAAELPHSRSRQVRIAEGQQRDALLGLSEGAEDCDVVERSSVERAGDRTPAAEG